MDVISIFKKRGEGQGGKQLSPPYQHNVPLCNYLDFTNFCI